jgi:hypothetical protein
MWLCSDLWTRTRLDRFSRGAGVEDARLHGTPGNKFAQNRQTVCARAGASKEALVQLDDVGILSRIWANFWHPRSFSSQMVGGYALFAILFAAIFFLCGFASRTTAAEPDDPPLHPVEISMTTGFQAEIMFKILLVDPNVIAGLKYFQDHNLYPLDSGFAQISFTLIGGGIAGDKGPSVAGPHTLFFVPVYAKGSSDPKKETKQILLVAKDRVSTHVFLATINPQTKGPPEVSDEKIVVDGKVSSGDGRMKSFFKCSTVGCVPAGLGCLLGGGAWAGCFCLWCGGAVVACGVTELFFP